MKRGRGPVHWDPIRKILIHLPNSSWLLNKEIICKFVQSVERKEISRKRRAWKWPREWPKYFSMQSCPYIKLSQSYFHSAHPTGWSESINKWNWTVCVCPSSLRRWSLFLLVGFTDPYDHTYSESLWWKLFKNHNRTQIQRQRLWQRQQQRQRHRQSAWKTLHIFEILMTYSFQIWW